MEYPALVLLLAGSKLKPLLVARALARLCGLKPALRTETAIPEILSWKHY